MYSELHICCKWLINLNPLHCNTIYGKMFDGETFVVFVVFHSIVNVFPRIMALSIGNVSLQACYRRSFPVNGNFVP